MKIEGLALAAAVIAERKGWAAVTSAAIAEAVKINRVSVSRSAPHPEIIGAARAIVRAATDTYPRAALELLLQNATHSQRVHALQVLTGGAGV